MASTAPDSGMCHTYARGRGGLIPSSKPELYNPLQCIPTTQKRCRRHPDRSSHQVHALNRPHPSNFNSITQEVMLGTHYEVRGNVGSPQGPEVRSLRQPWERTRNPSLRTPFCQQTDPRSIHTIKMGMCARSLLFFGTCTHTNLNVCTIGLIVKRKLQ